MKMDCNSKTAKLWAFRDAISECGDAGRLLDDREALVRGRDTFAHGDDCAPFVIVKLSTTDEVERALALARQHGLSVQPVSTGRNWGYGSIRPASSDTKVIFDLSGMTRILSFDEELGIVTVQPGVTQGDLDRFLKARDASYMVPTTGAGPSCSLLGNALERGYGLTPIADHFQAVLGLTAVLASGTRYTSPFLDPNGTDASRLPVYRWGVGPYLDGLFAQNGGAIVTSATIQLAPRPKRTEMFCFWLSDERHLPAAVAAVRELMTRSGLMIGGINLMNSARVSLVAGSSASAGAPWIGTGVLYGDPAAIAAGRKIIRRALSPLSRRVVFINPMKLRLLRFCSGIPLIGRKLTALQNSVASAHNVLSGYPEEFALPLAYSKRAGDVPESNLNPARDKCGLLWYAPIVPMRAASVSLYTEMANSICQKHGFDAAITFSTVSASGFDSTIPLVFPRDEANSARALECLRHLIDEGRKLGFQPYRFHSALMEEATSTADDHWRLAQSISAVIDPDGLLAPGRYQRPSPSFQTADASS